jgi:fructose-bisphosphate aldolase, class I
MDVAEMTAKIAAGHGFLAALDQSGGSTPKALTGYGVPAGSWTDDAGMYALIHEMRTRIIRSPVFTGDKVIGAILFERTMDGSVDGVPAPAALIAKGVVPFLKIDHGLEAEADGVQRMKPIPGLDPLLARARGLGVFGTKARSVIRLADPTGIAGVVEQQFALAEQVRAQGLMPILEPEIDITSPDRGAADLRLRDAILEALAALPAGTQVMLKLSLPAVPGSFDALVDHPGVLKVVALSGGYSRHEACAELRRNRGIIASFSRALLAELRRDMDDADFDRVLGAAIDEIYQASTDKVAG